MTRIRQHYSAEDMPGSLHVLKVNPAKGLDERLGFEVVADLGHSYEMRSNTGSTTSHSS